MLIFATLLCTCLLQVPTPGTARQSEASFYPDNPSVGSADSRSNSADVNAVRTHRELTDRAEWLHESELLILLCLFCLSSLYLRTYCAQVFFVLWFI